ncbi:MAG: class I SAM-dependent methyltransferase [Gammaproteobacteria bacterium]|jgi:16S rRNA (guanine1207-N2)-methyltransferase|uniref:methyltransferase n=1 Tax=Stutzerimonas xanthomarina TaxID=271420 RepID=UPI00190D4C1B|nr:class I SAM-dependent methyltransferase [Stutzerimonas xanthomarina]MBU0811537.1 class I SAM-dependent methyltransferase [Gammaproteobacteria bacterium]MBK3847554.1 methyltransferase [Stutzerimonas xanthomarina]MBU0851088.1 class I SAM-dependent methyltransferase [Gammaproteobacteria bacterium]MBU1300239.1 class I SAM-dependent methyltransferase [Gammaproteobacteria bacterium]MBU1458933.1 class I SAM-dependent methyltransferase [Gammaproteobacteria bacterium]|tara:strand:+ start:10014 stop:11141 length:1128 start_codon:yes stop_codon:yes gene_type:complete
MPILESPYARLDLVRQPEQPNEPLQAFDAADEYLLAQLHEQGLAATTRVLILNDSFGALACALAQHVQVTSSGDSHLAHLALEKNLQRNALADDAVTFVPASEVAQGPFDRVLIRVPKTLALLEEQLIRLHGQLAPGAQVIAAAMIKHLPRAAGDLLEKYIGPVQASLAVKKARLLTATPEDKPVPHSPYPTRYRLDQPALELLNHANLFCREDLDIGTRAFLPHLPKALGNLRAADLGCGNGVLGIVYALGNPQAQMTLVDESYMAVQSARENWQAIHGDRPADIRAGDGLAEQPMDSLDLVLCNPPFHQQQVVGDFLAWRMFTQAKTALCKGGELWIVGNRHLGYHLKLKRLFGKVEQVAATPKFVILRAIKP